MPRANKSTDDTPRRVSARVAAAAAKVDVVKTETPKSEPKPKTPKTKKNKSAESDKVDEVPAKMTKLNGNDSKDFEIVDKKDVPSHDSKEVKEAIDAQGPDGSLLVDVVQVTKDDVKDAPKEIINEKNGNTNGDSEKKDEDKAAVNGVDEAGKKTDSEKKLDSEDKIATNPTDAKPIVQENGKSS